MTHSKFRKKKSQLGFAASELLSHIRNDVEEWLCESKNQMCCHCLQLIQYTRFFKLLFKLTDTARNEAAVGYELTDYTVIRELHVTLDSLPFRHPHHHHHRCHHQHLSDTFFSVCSHQVNTSSMSLGSRFF